ncbi:putative aminoglycoside 3-N-acetyltransferase family protein [Octadecabacter antarcticus 307]|uniref:Aminoglycoside N(3)-acetyltransferase n=1 Tax=Octadecabacter antarcticus 307 TaxID=391626 RepID=M9RA48_9RHOB|nr:AAC(3) family N-acetyltransferase [Octadecabacter antarcticus]AGI68683.1 putative aminoglycoside 3-N-acetyltransferase family protein [Octadecabacter antarcticus 307]
MNDRLGIPLFIHSAIGRSLEAARTFGVTANDDVKATLLQFYASFANGDESRLMFPAFNYDYGKSRKFNVDEDPVQVGSFPEYMRTSTSFVRSEVPIFSFLSATDLGIKNDRAINPFGPQSGFQTLCDLNADLMFAGADLKSITFIHYIEEMVGPPLYRYAKSFPGQIMSKSSQTDCDFTMHVRPLGVHMDYDWPRLYEELQAEGIMRLSDLSDAIFFLNTRSLKEFWGNKLTDDPLCMLDELSLEHFKKATNGGTRRVSIEEYENV